jgi:hypothetical protein
MIREEEPQKPSTLLSTMAVEVRTGVAMHRDSEAAKLIRTIRGDLDWIVMKALEKDRNRRYETASGLARDIELHLIAETVQARPPSASYRFTRWVRRNKAMFAAAAGIAFALLVGTGVSLWQAVRAKGALSELQASAPAFIAMARGLAAREQFDEALEKLDVAIRLRPNAPDYLLAKANLLQSQFRFTEAVDYYVKALRLRPGDKQAEMNAALCRKLETEAAGQPKLSRESLRELFTTMVDQQRSAGEIMKVGRLLGEENKLLLSYWLERLRDFPIPPETPLERRLTIDEAGSMALDLTGTGIADLSQLKDMPLERLFLTGCGKVKDLTPLSGMPLRHLYLGSSASGARGCKITDLSALRGLRLVTLDINGLDLADISPLSGMPLEWLNLGGTSVRDLSPLKGMPLKYLDCTQIKARDFSVLAGAPITELNVNFNRIDDLSFLHGMPLKTLSVGCFYANGFEVLSHIPTLEKVVLPNGTPNLPLKELEAIAKLRDHPVLRSIQISGNREDLTLGVKTDGKDHFWIKFDADLKLRRAIFQIAGEGAQFNRLISTWMVILPNLPVTDITPLQGVPISTLELGGTLVTDLSPIRTIPLGHLGIGGTKVTDLGPLCGHLTLSELWLDYTNITDLRALSGCTRLSTLWLSGTKVTDLNPLRNLKLKQLLLDKCKPGIDLSPLADIATLEELVLPPAPKNLEVLRNHPNLKFLSYRWEGGADRVAQTAEEFWVENPPTKKDEIR